MRNKISGIYSLTNKTTGKRYIGQTVYLNGRKGDHLLNLRRDQHDNDYLQKAFNKYGEEDFIFEVLEVVPKLENGANNKDKLTEREQYWMDFYKVWDREYGYNINPSASINPMQGKTHTPEAKKKISEAAKGRKLSEEAKEKLHASRRGKPGTPIKEIVNYQTYKDYKDTAKYEYHLFDINNKEHIFYNLQIFSAINSVSPGWLKKMFNEHIFYKGWTGYFIDIKDSKFNL